MEALSSDHATIRAAGQPEHRQELTELAVVSAVALARFPCGWELLVSSDQHCRRDTDLDAATSSSPSPPAVCLI